MANYEDFESRSNRERGGVRFFTDLAFAGRETADVAPVDDTLVIIGCEDRPGRRPK